jgi:N-acetylneuraminic acid mutarotase
MNWEEVKTSGAKVPGALSNHSGIVHGDKMYLFGGSKDSGDSNDVMYTLDLQKYRWEVVEQAGEVPSTRDEHSTSLYENTMIVFGGFEAGERVNTIFRFHFAAKKWEQVKAKPGSPLPEPRAGHSSVIYKDTLVIFGGKNVENEKLNDVWAFSFTTLTWTQYQKNESKEGAPLARSGHSSSLSGQYMIVFGGILDVTKELDDMMIYDLENKRWTQLFEGLNTV